MFAKVLKNCFVFAFLSLLCLLSSRSEGWSQKSIRDSTIAFTMLEVGYGGYWPGANLADRFGYSSLAGGTIGYKFRNNFYATLGGYLFFGETVLETDMLNGLSFVLPRGERLWFDIDGNSFLPSFQQRGFAVPLRIGYIFSGLRFSGQNPNGGLFIELGAQFLQHFILIEGVPERSTFMEGEYAKGYDRLTNGMGGTASLGYRFFSNNRLINFYAAVELGVHYTQNRRSLNLDTMTHDDLVRTDILSGFRFGWVVPIYQASPDDYYYY